MALGRSTTHRAGPSSHAKEPCAGLSEPEQPGDACRSSDRHEVAVPAAPKTPSISRCSLVGARRLPHRAAQPQAGVARHGRAKSVEKLLEASEEVLLTALRESGSRRCRRCRRLRQGVPQAGGEGGAWVRDRSRQGPCCSHAACLGRAPRPRPQRARVGDADARARERVLDDEQYKSWRASETSPRQEAAE